MWAIIVRAFQWILRGTDSSSRENFDAVSMTNRVDFANVVTEWKAIAVDQRVRIVELERRVTELEAKEQICQDNQHGLEIKVMRLDWTIKNLRSAES